MNTLSSADIATLIGSKCTVSYMQGRALISCPSQREFTLLVQHRKNIRSALKFIIGGVFSGVEQVTIGVQGTDLRQSFSIEKPRTNMRIILPPNDLIAECLSYEGACGIVRVSDNKGLFSNELITASSNAHPNDWVGKNMSDYWFEGELQAYLERLNREGELRNYSYTAKLMTGEPVRLTVDARIVEWRGEPARIVKTITKELLT